MPNDARQQDAQTVKETNVEQNEAPTVAQQVFSFGVILTEDEFET